MPEQAPELIELFQNELASIDSQFQFWITVTFAVVVASYLAREQLRTTLRVTLACLYLFAVLLLAFRLGGHVQAAGYLMSALAELGVSYPMGNASLIGWLRRVLMVAGSLAALFFILRGPSGPPEDDAA